ncbi:LysR substrate-binding domain-containing protein [uncultured Sphingomonas sp.]|uniref:LysR substrate-binding domain-containing protein n=1 Tax=uncultured Sphingomonas sp. TaxID=158754 RepID=UPI0025F9519E|nr:LysR substrate-binding domain-containing protein [uncultured Sphingomonas sp.]
MTRSTASFKPHIAMQIIGLNDTARVDYNLVTAFLAIWRERSVSRAAAHLNLSQSAVSGSLARLRRMVDDPLFVRSRDGMQPTPRAIEIAPSLEAALAQMHDALSPQRAFAPAELARALTIGMSDDFMLACGPALLHRVVAAAPRASIIIRQCNRQTVEDDLESGRIELAMVASPARRSRTTRQLEIGTSGYRCLVDPAWADVLHPMTLDAYVGLPHVLVSYSGRSGAVDQALAAIGCTRHVAAALTQFAALPSFLLGSARVATLPSHAALALCRHTPLHSFDPPMAMERYPVALLWRRDRDADPTSGWLRELLRDAWREGGAEPADAR